MPIFGISAHRVSGTANRTHIQKIPQQPSYPNTKNKSKIYNFKIGTLNVKTLKSFANLTA